MIGQACPTKGFKTLSDTDLRTEMLSEIMIIDWIPQPKSGHICFKSVLMYFFVGSFHDEKELD